jgi:hypothetical protein
MISRLDFLPFVI